MAPQGPELSEMSADDLVEHLNNAAPPGTPMTEQGEDVIRALEDQQNMDDRLDVSSPKNIIKNTYNQNARGHAPAMPAPQEQPIIRPAQQPPAPSVP